MGEKNVNIKIDSMKEKVSKIVKSTFSNEWTNPSGGTTYYYDVIFENGDTGSIGVTDKQSEKIKVGTELSYTIMNGKIKVSQMPNIPENKPTYNGQTSYKKGKSTQDQFLGYAWSYAKDLVVAGKGMKDVEELNQVARYIYDQIGSMLSESSN